MLLDEKETSGSGLFQVNMTPMIDVSLVLVITLLLMTPLALESGIWVRNHNDSTAMSDPGPDPERVHVTILTEDLVQVQNRILRRDNLRPVLGAMLRQPRYAGVALVCADDVSHAAFVDVLDQAKMSGAVSIAISEESSGG